MKQLVKQCIRLRGISDEIKGRYKLDRLPTAQSKQTSEIAFAISLLHPSDV